eukprot:2153904-Amphidinium_carterae.5
MSKTSNQQRSTGAEVRAARDKHGQCALWVLWVFVRTHMGRRKACTARATMKIFVDNSHVSFQTLRLLLMMTSGSSLEHVSSGVIAFNASFRSLQNATAAWAPQVLPTERHVFQLIALNVEAKRLFCFDLVHSYNVIIAREDLMLCDGFEKLVLAKGNISPRRRAIAQLCAANYLGDIKGRIRFAYNNGNEIEIPKACPTKRVGAHQGYFQQANKQSQRAHWIRRRPQGFCTADKINTQNLAPDCRLQRRVVLHAVEPPWPVGIASTGRHKRCTQ